jgi:methionyl-tRNA formyltransferase
MSESSMKIGLFAAGTVGSEIARFFSENHEPLACLALDSKDREGLNAAIAANSGLSDPARIFYSASLSTEQILSALASLRLDLIILAWWPYIIERKLIELPRLGCLNFHPSYLPFNRGKHYNFWTLVEDVPFGVTLNWVSEGVDNGHIAFQSPIAKSWEDTGESLYHKAQAEIVRLFKEKFPEIKNQKIPRIAQDLGKGSFHKAKELEAASRIELEERYRARDLLNLLRARTFPPYPGAWFVDDGTRYEVRVQIKRVDGQQDEKQTRL